MMEGRKGTMDFDKLMEIEWVSTPAVQPSGRFVAYVITRYDQVENNKRSTIMLANLESLEKKELTPGRGSHSDPSWSPDGRMLAFISDRDEGKQVWVLPLEEGGKAFKLSDGIGDASRPVWSPDGSRIIYAKKVVVSEHWDGDPDDLPIEGRERIAHAKTYDLVNEKSSARIESSLLFRHWDEWRSMKRSHLFIVDLLTKEEEDVTPVDADVPPISLGGIQDYSFSPEGDEIVYVMNPDKVVTFSTNNSIFLQKLDGLRRVGKALKISTTNARDIEPRYGPDNRYLIYLGAEKESYESDKLNIKIYDRSTGETRVLTKGFDRSATNPVWSHDGAMIFFLAPDLGFKSLYSLDIENVNVHQHTSGSYNADLTLVPGKGLLVTRQTATRPADIYLIEPGNGFDPFTGKGPGKKGAPGETFTKITDHGDWVEKELSVSPLEEFWYEGADSEWVHGFLIKPPGFDKKRRYPAILIIHGGPQSAFFDNFPYRWNPQIFASEGHVVIQLNPRGSIGYGQKFTDQISRDWGGRCYEDIMKGVDHCIKNYPFIDEEQISAAGASFGGFIINWIAGHTDRFKALVSHDGIFNSETAAYMTDELWFEVWEHGGMPHEDHEAFLRYSPHMFVQNFKTPMLVIQGEQDFRCPVSEGISLFTALQVMEVPSKLLYFHDEGHWVLKPANAQVWYRTILDFINKYGVKE